MRVRVLLPLLLLVLGALAGCSERNLPDAPRVEAGITLRPVLDALQDPVFITHAGDGTEALYIVEQSGMILRWTGEGASAVPFLDLRNRIEFGMEQGVLGLAFAPDVETSRQFYVHYSGLPDGDTVVSRFRLDATDPAVADPASEEVILRHEQPYPNHNGGMLAFGPDGMLYIGLGDGGSAGDPHGNGQDKGTLLGKLLRIDVSRVSVGDDLRPMPYAIPADNPFVDEEGARGEIYAYGLRNPWRFSFDRQTGDLWIGDVGQGDVEEVDLIPAGSGGGQNFGWNVFEGSTRYRSGDAPGHVRPIAEYDHDNGCAVTGGYVYRGTQIPSLQGAYLYGDYCSGHLWVMRNEDGKWTPGLAMKTGLNISSFGEDKDGELFVVDLQGSIHRIVAT